MASFIKVCPKCNKENEVTMDFCVGCGNHIKLVIPTKSSGNIDNLQSPNNVKQTTGSTIKYYKLCRVCGNKCYLTNKDQFLDVCSFCGNEDINDIPTNEEVIKTESKQNVSTQTQSQEPVKQKKISYGLKDSNGLIINLCSTSIIGRYGDVNPEYFNQNPYVSGNHVRIGCQGDRWFIEDLNSTNGTRINGKNCTPGIKYLLKPGFKITLANLELEWVSYED